MGADRINSTSIRHYLLATMPPCCKGIHDYVPRMSDHLRDSPRGRESAGSVHGFQNMTRAGPACAMCHTFALM